MLVICFWTLYHYGLVSSQLLKNQDCLLSELKQTEEPHVQSTYYYTDKYRSRLLATNNILINNCRIQSNVSTLPSPVFVSTHSSWFASDGVGWLPPIDCRLSEEGEKGGNPGGGMDKFGKLLGGCIIGPGPGPGPWGYQTTITMYTLHQAVL